MAARMVLLTAADRKRLPALYAQEEKGEDAVAYVKVFDPTSQWTWYITEGVALFEDKDGKVTEAPLSELTRRSLGGLRGGWYFHTETFAPVADIRLFGMVHGHEKVLGYISWKELRSVRGKFGLWMERDTRFTPTKVSDL